tara:strand:- start:69 stop:296 length:228 start_codon:yes stop_codon:yes gene_type:complete
MDRIDVGDLVRFKERYKENFKIGIVIDVSPQLAHLVSHGRTRVIRVYWPTLDTTDWEYDFFLEKIEPLDLTKKKK